MLSLKNRVLVAALALPLSMSPLVAFPAFAASSIDAPSDIALRRGDLVRLRSGGPLMTVYRIDGDKVDCFWTDINGQPNDASFPANILQKI